MDVTGRDVLGPGEGAAGSECDRPGRKTRTLSKAPESH